VVLVSATTLMSDVPMLALWTWGAALWIEGSRADDARRLAAASLLFAAAGLTKYLALSAIPLVAVWTLLGPRRRWTALAWLLVPVAAALAYHLYTAQLYGRGLVSDAAGYAWAMRDRSLGMLARGALVAPAFAGGCLLPVLFLAPLRASRRALLAGAAFAGLAVVALVPLVPVLAPSLLDPPRWLLAAHMSVFVLTCELALLLAALDLARHRDAESALLALWLVGPLVFTAFVNWDVNARSLLPMAPPAAILLARRLEGVTPARWLAALVPALSLALLVAWADRELAEVNRRAAARIARDYADRIPRSTFQGHWGFQYYMQLHGSRAFAVDGTTLESGDLMFLPLNNTNIKIVEMRDFVAQLEAFGVERRVFAATMEASRAAGFHSAAMGPLPFVFDRPGVLQFVVAVVTDRVRLEPKLD
jgi:hypothetical protein